MSISEPEFIKKCENGVCAFVRKPENESVGDGNQNQLSCPVSGAAAKKEN